ncbi:MAG: methyltransferase domain-containing protein [Leptolyngbyaceae cyanobacterium RU_5_1]|nr:methyltransferase domain-containing protein [Leptolyngbyaceae cyanobacterium RU_5_1]
MSTIAISDLKTKVKAFIKQALRQSPQFAQASLGPQFDRKTIADYYLKGTGIEIGALHNPLQVPVSATVQYVDRMAVSDLKQHYPELAALALVDVDILDDGEHLNTIPDSSQDFVIANHFIEHCQDPIRAIQNMLRVLKSGGILYLGIPDKRHTFDVHRPITDIDHLLKDYYQGSECSRKQHYIEWAKYPWLGYKSESEGNDDPRIESEANRFMEMDYSIHFHVWTKTEILELVVTLQQKLKFKFDVELFLSKNDEMILVLKKED